MTSLTFATLAVIAVGLLNRRGYCVALAVSGVTGAGAFLAFGGVVIPTFYAVAVGAALLLVARGLNPGRVADPPLPYVAFLVAFLAWSVGVTLTAPFLFPGLQTVTPASAILQPGVVSSSNVAQIVYLLLGICVVVYIAREQRARVDLIGLIAGGATLLSMWRYLHQQIGLPYIEGVFDNSPAFAVIETAPGGGERFRGIFSEPAGLAGICIVMIAYGIPRLTEVRGMRRLGLSAVIGSAVYLGTISTSVTFVVAGLALAGLALAALLAAAVGRRVQITGSWAILLCATAIVALFALPHISEFATASIEGKVAGSSYSDRSGADTASYAVFLDTWGFGVGLGAARASSVLPTLLSATGLIGSVLLVSALMGLLVLGIKRGNQRPVVWALVGSVLTRLIAGPELSDSTGVIWIALGLLAQPREVHSVIASSDWTSSAPKRRGSL